MPWISTERPAAGLKISQRPQKRDCPCPSEPPKCCTLPCQPWEHSPYVQPHCCRAVTPPAPGWMGRKGRRRQALGLLFFTLSKNAGEGGEEGSKFLSLCYHSCLAKGKLRKHFGWEKLRANWVLPLRRRAGGMRGSGNICPALRQKGLALTCCEPFGPCESPRSHATSH